MAGDCRATAAAMTTLETKPIAFFFSPLSVVLPAGGATGSCEPGAGTAVLSIRSPSVRSRRAYPQRQLESRSIRRSAQVAIVPKASRLFVQLVQGNARNLP